MQSSKYERMSCNIHDIINPTGKEYACHECTVATRTYKYTTLLKS